MNAPATLFRPHLVDTQVATPGKLMLTRSQLDLIWDMNRDLNQREFDQFIETSRALGLNPLARQICTIVFSKNDPSKRQMAIITTISGLRAIADRTGTYRPDDEAPRFEFDADLKNPQTNPHGLISCTVTPYTFQHGGWHKVVGQVWWDEIAPIRDYGGVKKLDARTPWPARPRGQFAKCAEADALRKGWPENLANVYVQEEVDRSIVLDIAPSKVAEEARIERISDKFVPKGTIIMDMFTGNGLQPLEIGKFYDACDAFIKANKDDDPEGVISWKEQNRIGLQQFWAHDKAAALDLKRKLEEIENRIAGEEAAHGDQDR